MRLTLICVALVCWPPRPSLILEWGKLLPSGIAHPLTETARISVRHGTRWPLGCAQSWPRGLGVEDGLRGNGGRRFYSRNLGLANDFRGPFHGSSIFWFGLLVALAANAPVWLGARRGAVCILYGHAHGTEALGANLIPYAVGFAVTTAGLHVADRPGSLAEGSIGKVAVRVMGGLQFWAE